MSTQKPPRNIIKIIIVGDSRVGKTNILRRISSNKFDADFETTIGVEFASKSRQIDNEIVKAQIWDTAGQEVFKAICQLYYKGSVGAIIVYDITDYASFLNVEG